jgi:phytoene dehydrogenase-like protein
MGAFEGYREQDVVIVGGGHNGLVAAAYLARAGKSVLVLERLGVTGGAAVSTRPFAGVDARLSRYSYLVSLLPRKIVRDLGLDFRVRGRTVSSYTPTERDGRPTGLLVGGGERRTREAFARLTGSGREYQAWQRFYGMTGRVAKKVFPTLTEPLPTRDELRRRVDDEEAWRTLFEEPLGVTVEDNFSDDLVRGVVLTDALIGTFADAHDPSLRQNRCFLYHVIGGGTGAWDVPVGGMGALTDAIAGAARAAGAVVATGHEAVRVETDGRAAEVTYRTADGERTVSARHVLVNASPQELARLTGDEPPAPAEGAQLKVNMLLKRLPRLRDTSVDPREAFSGTFHIAEGYEQLATAHAQAAPVRCPRRRPPRSTATRSPIRRSSARTWCSRATTRSRSSVCTPPPGSSPTTTTAYARSCSSRRSRSWTRTSPNRSPTAWRPTRTAAPASRRRHRSTWSATCGCPAATSSTATSPSPTRRRARAAGAWRPRTRTSCCAARARCAAAG